jgi:deoxyribodipyrimidine photo-lyase
MPRHSVGSVGLSGGVPSLRMTVSDGRPPNVAGEFVLYWMTSARRAAWNFALDQGIAWARSLKRPLVVVESLTCGGRWDSDRHHAFVLQGMRDNRQAFARSPIGYYPFVERTASEGNAFLAALAKRACVIIEDNFPRPASFLEMHAVECRTERIDSNGLLPLQATERAYPTAFAFRRFLQKNMPDHWLDRPSAKPLARLKLPPPIAFPATLARRWPQASPELLETACESLRELPIDHAVRPVATQGGSATAHRTLRRFIESGLPCYAADRNHPDAEAASGLSPYLHHGHISAHEVFWAIAESEDWTPGRASDRATGSREGWWGLGSNAEAFVDQLVTWRELGYNMARHVAAHDRFESLPDWAQATLAKHARDHRPVVYSPTRLEAAETDDPVWNAAQRQLRCDGMIHNYLRMLWGKRVVEWTRRPRDAAAILIELNNRYALDGQDPNSYSGVFWILGRYDRPWGPERPIYGRIRYMSSQNAFRKLRMKEYLARYGAHSPLTS